MAKETKAKVKSEKAISMVRPLSKEETPKIELEFDEIIEAIKVIVGKSPSEAMAEAIKDLSKQEKLLYYTDVEKREIANISVMKVIAERYNLSWLRDYIDYELKLRVSKKRQGRKELVRVIAGVKKALEQKVKGLIRKGESEPCLFFETLSLSS